MEHWSSTAAAATESVVLLQQRALLMLVHASCVTWGLMHLGRAAFPGMHRRQLTPALWLLHLLLLLLLLLQQLLLLR
jgi:hypothetical protein